MLLGTAKPVRESLLGLHPFNNCFMSSLYISCSFIEIKMASDLGPRSFPTQATYLSQFCFASAVKVFNLLQKISPGYLQQPC